MERIVVQEIEVPSASLAMRSLPRLDFADAFRCQLPDDQLQNIDSVTRAIFLTMPRAIAQLLEFRNVIVRPFGLKTSIDAAPSSSQEELQPGTAVGAFEILGRRQNDEIMLGEDDKHLDYRVSIQLERGEKKCWVIVSTVVKFNNWLGRVYFAPVRPVHKIIVPVMMRHGLERSKSRALGEMA
ncbi:DUF2867 domain-containing protein [Nodosilinea sp. LEGE 06152]|uniref:DUF2867 domain-containing protein n=1 Tax=Nodosilinea sp. LEGE 06152 TaxID=2777966 RepID=UPI00187F67A8|nr:DUF2867 domain-containing protein [Nodosilinea sp. LEGE 06152]MBE9159494.1 DUF2867 domain-containing protein [Nodosilinea sp. LEGE 06152]